MMHIMIDGDWVLYTAGFASQHTEYVVSVESPGAFYGPYESKSAIKEEWADASQVIATYARTYTDPLDHALHSAKKMMQAQVDKVVERFDPEDFDVCIYLDGEGNFRHDVATIRPYKGNRVNSPKPILYPEIREYLEGNYQTDVSFDCESDDRLAIQQTAYRAAGEQSIIVGVDKDLLQVPGLHLNPNKGFKKISVREGNGRLFRQAVMGDAVDNIAGAYKVGPAAAKKLIKPGMSEQEMWEATVGAYQASIEKYPEDGLYGGLDALDAALENMRLVYLQREPDDRWQPPEVR
jgi:hypothetical protein